MPHDTFGRPPTLRLLEFIGGFVLWFAYRCSMLCLVPCVVGKPCAVVHSFHVETFQIVVPCGLGNELDTSMHTLGSLFLSVRFGNLKCFDILVIVIDAQCSVRGCVPVFPSNMRRTIVQYIDLWYMSFFFLRRIQYLAATNVLTGTNFFSFVSR
jgi:hypothetical protein